MHIEQQDKLGDLPATQVFEDRKRFPLIFFIEKLREIFLQKYTYLLLFEGEKTALFREKNKKRKAQKQNVITNKENVIFSTYYAKGTQLLNGKPRCLCYNGTSYGFHAEEAEG
ncbi:MAG: hypothetical protein ACI3XZ_01195 [Butyricicoccus sp.]